MWRDPVWSQLIAESLKWLAKNWGVVAGGLTGLLALGSLFSKRLAVMWDALAKALGSLLSWLAAQKRRLARSNSRPII
jgi:hypothetical protein